MACSRSSALPCGTPSMMSIRTTSASSLAAIQWAAVAPTFPAPTIETFLRISFLSSHSGHAYDYFSTIQTPCAASSVPFSAASALANTRGLCQHVLDDRRGEFARPQLGRALHQTLKVIGHAFLLDGLLHAVFHQFRGLHPANVLQHHHRRQNDRAGIDHVLVRILGRGAVGGFKDGRSEE